MNGQKDTAGKQNKGFSLITVIIAVMREMKCLLLKES